MKVIYDSIIEIKYIQLLICIFCKNKIYIFTYFNCKIKYYKILYYNNIEMGAGGCLGPRKLKNEVYM